MNKIFDIFSVKKYKTEIFTKNNIVARFRRGGGRVI